MDSKNHSNLNSRKRKIKKEDKKDLDVKIKGKKIYASSLENKQIKQKKNFIRNCLTRKNILYFILFLFDVILVIYVAKQNVVNYVNVSGENIFVSKTRYLLVGRNYITLIVILFFYGYTCLMKRFFLHEKLTKKFLIWLLVFLVILNFGLFFVFTKRVY